METAELKIQHTPQRQNPLVHINPDGSEGGLVDPIAIIGKGVYIHPTAHVIGSCILEDKVIIDERATVIGADVISGVKQDRSTNIGEGSVVGVGAHVARGAIVEDGAVLCEESWICVNGHVPSETKVPAHLLIRGSAENYPFYNNRTPDQA